MYLQIVIQPAILIIMSISLFLQSHYIITATLERNPCISNEYSSPSASHCILSAGNRELTSLSGVRLISISNPKNELLSLTSQPVLTWFDQVLNR